MEYNDFLEQFDTKTFEILAKEYAKNSPKKAQILQKNEQNFDFFIQKFEDFLMFLMLENRCVFGKKKEVISLKKSDKKQPLENVITSFCKLYYELKNEYYLPPYACKIGSENCFKKEAFDRAKELIFLSNNCLQKCHQNALVDNVFLLIKIL